jgi:hypothetical protein
VKTFSDIINYPESFVLIGRSKDGEGCKNQAGGLGDEWFKETDVTLTKTDNYV